MVPSRPSPRCAGLLLALTLVPAGCANDPDKKESKAPPQEMTIDQVSKMRDPNVIEVAAFYNPFDPWLWTESRERPRGIVIRALYLMGPRYKGVFGDGVIRPMMYLKNVSDKGEVTWKLIKEWSFTAEESVPWRSKRQTQMGWGYRLHLQWDDVYRLAGREIRMVVEFDRADGRKIASDKKDFRVPGPNAS